MSSVCQKALYFLHSSKRLFGLENHSQQTQAHRRIWWKDKGKSESEGLLSPGPHVKENTVRQPLRFYFSGTKHFVPSFPFLPVPPPTSLPFPHPHLFLFFSSFLPPSLPSCKVFMQGLQLMFSTGVCFLRVHFNLQKENIEYRIFKQAIQYFNLYPQLIDQSE